MPPATDFAKLWEDIKANHAKLDACSGHRFGPPGSILRTRTCLKCGGTMDTAGISWYIQGWVHRGGDPKDVLG